MGRELQWTCWNFDSMWKRNIAAITSVFNEHEVSLTEQQKLAKIMIDSYRDLGWDSSSSIIAVPGILRTMYTDPDLVADYMPVDIAIKSFIVASWIRGTKE
ncbi:hypothetical protein HF086_011015 [Spodoptera exigua]|uniref:Uncharacterized protein n=1 Tax=Spodoptera exigua TaxID=7107 RepID=A0A922MTL4_SPOEX|nr:hypothetical protein HF086_011015 [Spodoptera exigua]